MLVRIDSFDHAFEAGDAQIELRRQTHLARKFFDKTLRAHAGIEGQLGGCDEVLRPRATYQRAGNSRMNLGAVSSNCKQPSAKQFEDRFRCLRFGQPSVECARLASPNILQRHVIAMQLGKRHTYEWISTARSERYADDSSLQRIHRKGTRLRAGDREPL